MKISQVSSYDQNTRRLKSRNIKKLKLLVFNIQMVYPTFFACMFDDSLWKSYVYRTISLMSSIRIYVYFFTHLVYYFNFTVVYIFQIKGGIPPPSGGIVGKNQSTRNMPPELPACSCDPRYQKPFWQQRLSLDLLFFPTYSIVLLNPDF